MPLRYLRPDPGCDQAGGRRQGRSAPDHCADGLGRCPMKPRDAGADVVPVADAEVDVGRRSALKLSGLTIAFLWAGTSGTVNAPINARPQPAHAPPAAP